YSARIGGAAAGAARRASARAGAVAAERALALAARLGTEPGAVAGTGRRLRPLARGGSARWRVPGRRAAGLGYRPAAVGGCAAGAALEPLATAPAGAAGPAAVCRCRHCQRLVRRGLAAVSG